MRFQKSIINNLPKCSTENPGKSCLTEFLCEKWKEDYKMKFSEMHVYNDHKKNFSYHQKVSLIQTNLFKVIFVTLKQELFIVGYIMYHIKINYFHVQNYG